MSPVRNYETTRIVRPIVSGSSIYFVVDQVSASKVMEWSRSEGFSLPDAAAITAHVPTYLPANITHVAASSNESTVVFASPDEPGSLYVYRFFLAHGAQKIQSSWSRWNIGGGATLIGMSFVRSILYLLLSRSDGLHLESLDFRQLVDGGLDHRVHLDSLTQTTGVYSAATQLTTFTLPYFPVGTEAYTVVLTGSGWGAKLGKVLTATFADDALTVTVEGDFSAHAVHVGREFASLYGFSAATLDQRLNPQSSREALPVTEGNLVLKRWRVLFTETGAFDAKVRFTHNDPDVFVDPFSGRNIDDPETDIGTIALREGVFEFDASGAAESLRAEIHSKSYLPFTLTGGGWKGHYVSQAADA